MLVKSLQWYEGTPHFSHATHGLFCGCHMLECRHSLALACFEVQGPETLARRSYLFLGSMKAEGRPAGKRLQDDRSVLTA